MPAYKIASFENTDYLLLKKVAKTNKPIIISTGMANIAEIHNAIEIIKSNGNSEIILLKCTSSYPSSMNEMISTTSKIFVSSSMLESPNVLGNKSPMVRLIDIGSVSGQSWQ